MKNVGFEPSTRVSSSSDYTASAVSIYMGYTFVRTPVKCRYITVIVILDFLLQTGSLILSRDHCKKNNVVSCTVTSVLKPTVTYRRRH